MLSLISMPVALDCFLTEEAEDQLCGVLKMVNMDTVELQAKVCIFSGVVCC